MTYRSTLALALATIGFEAFAAPAFDSAADAAYNSGWVNGSNGGFGFLPWQFGGSPGPHGNFLASSNGNGSGAGPGIDSAGRAWGQWANSGGVGEVFRTFSAPLGLGDSFECDLDNGWIDPGEVVVQLRGQLGFGCAFRFLGGQNNYEFGDPGYMPTTLPFTDGGVHLKWTMTATGYDFSATGLSTSQVWMHSGVWPLAIPIDQVYFDNNNAGFNSTNDAYLNNLRITPAPEPGTICAVGIGVAAIARRRRRS